MPLEKTSHGPDMSTVRQNTTYHGTESILQLPF